MEQSFTEPLSKLKYHAVAWQQAIALFFKNDALSAAGNMAFLGMLSIFPFIIFLFALAGFMGQTDRGIEAIDFLFTILPPEVAVVLDGPIKGIINNTGAEILTGSIMLAIWTAAAGLEAARGILIRAFGRKNARAAWVRRLESLAVVVLGGLSVIASMSILVLGPALLQAFTSLFPDAYTADISKAWNYLRLLVSPAVLLLGLYVVYATLTPRRIKKPSRLPGSLLCLFVFIATAKGLSVYLQYAGNYDVTYGSLAGVVIMQLFCFIVSLGFALGAELNAAYTGLRASSKQLELGPDPRC